jgi:AraC-like DNA-binding protein
MTKELLEAVTRYTTEHMGQRAYVTPFEGLTILRSVGERQPSHVLIRPALCIVVQGAKWTTFGSRRYVYRAGQALLVSVEMPAVGRVTQASPSEPFLGVVIELDPGVMREVIEGLDDLPPPADERGRGVFVTDIDGPIEECALRLVRLLRTPKAIPTLRPVIMRELCYWLLTGPYGGDVARLMLTNSHAHRVVVATHELRRRFADTVRVEDLAAIAQMSPSAFHRQFKALTSMTPIQFQKRLRLLEARQLMAVGGRNVETAAFEVGYESPSQFSREYSRMFGVPPRRHAVELRALASA